MPHPDVIHLAAVTLARHLIRTGDQPAKLADALAARVGLDPQRVHTAAATAEWGCSQARRALSTEPCNV